MHDNESDVIFSRNEPPIVAFGGGVTSLTGCDSLVISGWASCWFVTREWLMMSFESSLSECNSYVSMSCSEESSDSVESIESESIPKWIDVLEWMRIWLCDERSVHCSIKQLDENEAMNWCDKTTNQPNNQSINWWTSSGWTTNELNEHFKWRIRPFEMSNDSQLIQTVWIQSNLIVDTTWCCFDKRSNRIQNTYRYKSDFYH